MVETATTNVIEISKQRKGTRLSEGWKPTKAGKTYAKNRHWSLEEIRDEIDNFVEYYTNGKGKNQTRISWPRTWQTWVRKNYSRNGAGVVPIKRAKKAPTKVWKVQPDLHNLNTQSGPPQFVEHPAIAKVKQLEATLRLEKSNMQKLDAEWVRECKNMLNAHEADILNHQRDVLSEFKTIKGMFTGTLSRNEVLLDALDEKRQLHDIIARLAAPKPSLWKRIFG